MELWECDNLFDHTRKLRIGEEQASIDANSVIERLLKKWANVDSADLAAPPTPDDDFRRFEKDLQELVKRNETPAEYVHRRPLSRQDSWDRPRPVIRERSLSRPRTKAHRLPPPRRYNGYRNNESKTDYWRPWGDQAAQLFASLKFRGWQPVYMRGTGITHSPEASPVLLTDKQQHRRRPNLVLRLGSRARPPLPG
jgi:hypothetical protein